MSKAKLLERVEPDAGELLAALRSRHLEDVFVPECKDGATQSRKHLRLDAWVLLKTWSPVTSIGYEVKVSRADWRRDEKLSRYYPLCNLLYVVAPKGIVPREELPKGVGLLEPVGDAGRLITRHKAAWRAIDVPLSLLLYVLISRTKIKDDADRYGDGDRRAYQIEQLRAWANAKDDRRELSYALSEKIRSRFDDQERRQRALEEKIKRLEQIEARIRELGFDPNFPNGTWEITDRLKKLAGVVPGGLTTTIARVERELAFVREGLEALEGKTV